MMNRRYPVDGEYLTVNDIPYTVDGLQLLQDVSFTTIESDILDDRPSCLCGDSHNEGTTCDRCGITVKHLINKSITPRLFISAPEGIPGLIDPKFMLHLLEVFQPIKNRSWGGFHVIEYLLDKRINPKTIYPPVAQILNDYRIERGYTFFCNNVVMIIRALLKHNSHYRAKAKDLATIPLDVYIEESISDGYPFAVPFLPIHNKAMVIFENTPLNNYMMKKLHLIKEVCLSMLAIDDRGYSPSEKEDVVGSVMMKYGGKDMFSISDAFVSGKHGLIKSSIFSTAAYMNTRAVIIDGSDTLEHPDDIELPYASFITVYKTEILAKLINKHNYTINSALAFIHEHTLVYSEELYNIGMEIIKDAGGRLEGSLQRYPCTHPWNVSGKGMKTFKKDPRDPAITIHSQNCPIYNHDYDGDECHFHAHGDRHEAELMEPLKSKHAVISSSKPYTIAPYLTQMSLNTANQSSFLKDENAIPYTEEGFTQMMKLFG